MPEDDGYRPISFSTARALSRAKEADFALYLPAPNDDEPVLYREEAAGLSAPDFKRLKEGGNHCLLIRKDHVAKCEHLVEAGLGKLLEAPDIEPAQKSEVLHSVGATLAEQLINHEIQDEQVRRASTFVDNIIQGLLHDATIVSHVLHMAEYQRSAASHMMIVSALAIVLGHEVFGEDQQTLQDLGMAGMLHDLGKLGIGPEVLHKDTSLTRDEARIIQQHPIESVRLLQDAPHVTTDVRQMIVQHHERVDGNGYPIRLRGPELLTGSRILTIVDTFHAMIGRGFYHGALTVPEALRTIERQAGRQFDADLVACWVNLFSRIRADHVTANQTELIGPSQEESFRHEHRVFPKSSPPASPNSLRALCDGRATVKCVYAGRIRDLSAALNEFIAPLHELSRDGMCLHTPHPLYRGEILNVRVRIGGGDVWLRAVVLSCTLHEEHIYKTQLQFLQRIAESEVGERVNPRGIDEMERLLAAPAQPEEPQTTQTPYQSQSARDTAIASLAAIAALPSISQAKASAVIALSQSGDPEVRLRAIPILTRIRSQSTIDTLVQLLADPVPAIRRKAVLAIGALQRPELRTCIQEKTKDPDPEVARAAEAIMAKLTPDNVH